MKLRIAVVGIVVGTVWGVQAATVLDVRIEHAKGIKMEEESVRIHLTVKPGQIFERAALLRDVKTLKDTKRFSEVSANVEPSGDDVIVVYVVHPRVTIRRIQIDGAEHMSNRKIRKLLDLGVGDPVDEAVLAVRVQDVINSYRKSYYPNAKVTWKIVENPEEGTADVTVYVEEGKKIRVKSITFDGGEAISGWRLRKLMNQKKANLLSFITGRGTLSLDELENDRLLLKKAFLDLGYLDVDVGEPQLKQRGAKKVAITVPIKEGSVYHLGTTRLEGVNVFTPEEVADRSITLLEGQVASMAEIEDAAREVRDYYGSRGYINTRVVPLVSADPARLIANVTFRVVEGKPARIRNIELHGNTRTRDKVIRRELAVYPGDIFNEVKVRTSENRLRNLGYFKFVGSSPVATPRDEEYDLVFELEEQRSGQFAVGAGFSSVDDIIGFVELSQGNFDIKNPPNFTGGGQKFKIRLQLGTERRDWEVSFTEPWFLDQRLALGFEVFQHERRFLSNDYEQRNTGGSVSLTRSIRGPYRLKFTYSLEDIEVFNVDDSASEDILLEEGSRIKSAGELALIRDTRDNYFLPTRGARSVASVTYAGGPFAGETDLYELRFQQSSYFPLWFEHVFSLRGTLAGVKEHSGADRVPIFDRLFLGGGRSLRGFKFRDVGPKDENGEPVGGRTSFFGSAEYTVPVMPPVRAAVFYDVGMVYVDAFSLDVADLNSDVGVGLRLDIPGFPLQLDYAWPLEADEFNDSSSGRFNFFIGYQL